MKKKPLFWKIFLVVLVVLVAYGQTLLMYFWQDDSALIFKLQNPEGLAGSFGYGIIGGGPYKYLVMLFVPFFPLFGLEPFWYFLVGLLSYLVVVWMFWLFAKELFNKEKPAYFSTLLFAAGYVGSDIMFRIINSWQTNLGLVLGLICLWRFVVFIKKRKISDYLLSLAFYFAATEFVFIRSHGLIFPIFVLDILFLVFPFKFKKIWGLVARQIPFFLIFRLKYLSDESFGAPGIFSLLKDVFLRGQIEKISPIFANTGNGLIPTVVQSKLVSFLNIRVVSLHGLIFVAFLALIFLIWKSFKVSKKEKLISILALISGLFLNYFFYTKSPLWYRDVQSVIAGLIGIEVLILTIFYSKLLWKKNRILSAAILFGLFTLISQVSSYYIQYPTSIFSTTHRYFSYSLIGYSIFWGTLIFLSIKEKKKTLSFFLLLSTLGLNLYLGFVYQRKIVKERSDPSRKFYQDLKASVPEIQKGAVFYFDIISEPFYQKQFNDSFSVGSMPETTALAIYYQVDRYDVKMTTNFEEFLSWLSKREIDLDNTYTFFYGNEGLVNTTDETIRLLKKGGEKEFVKFREKQLGVSFDVENTKPLTPVIFSFTAKINLDTDSISYPYLSIDELPYSYSFKEKQEIISYLLDRERFYKEAKIESTSEWRFQEAINALDKDLDTSWRGHRIWWHDNAIEQLTIDLGKVASVNRLIWTNWIKMLAPTNYSIETSLNASDWKVVKQVLKEKERENSEVMVEEFQPVNARFVRMNISKTLTDDSPAISEIEVVETKHASVDITKAFAFLGNPFARVENKDEMQFLASNAASFVNLEIEITTDKEKVKDKVPLGAFGVAKNFEIILPAGGRKIKDVFINIPGVPVKILPISASFENLSFNEIEGRGFIKEFSEN